MPRTVLVPYNGSSADDMLQIACQVVGRDGRVVALATTQVHRALPLADLPAFFDEPGWNALLHAREVAEECGLQIEPRLSRTYDTAGTIVHEARSLRADIIFLAVKRPCFFWLPLRLGRTARAVVREAPCPVVLGYFLPRRELDQYDVVEEAQRLLSAVQ